MATVELLAPAGNPEALAAALGEGADAVYLGLKTFNARIRSSNFAFNQFEATVEAAHKLSRKVYVTVNTVFVEREADRLYQLLQYIERVGPDGVIVQDLGTVKIARDHFPGLRLHASTQMNVGSAAGANFLSRHGFKRVVLSRELSLEEIRKAREGTNMELEVFVHGALCVSASGLCLFSSYLGGKSANRGLCAQACRRLYSTDETSGFYFSPADLELVSRVPDLVEAGVSSLKIEGRLKSQEYVGAVVAAYRYMLDNWRMDRERALLKAQSMLQADFARSKTLFNIDGSFPADFINPEQAGGTGIKLGRVKEVRAFEGEDGEKGQWALVMPRHADDGQPEGIGVAGVDEGGGSEAAFGAPVLASFGAPALAGFGARVGGAVITEGDSIRIHRADDSGRLTLKVKDVRENPRGVYLRLEGDFRVGDEVYLVQTRSMGKRWKPVLPKELGKYHKFPSRDEVERPRLSKPPKEALAALGEGLYALVGRVGDLHVLLSDRPEKAMLLFNRKNSELMHRHEKELPFRRESLVLWLDPYFPEGDSAWLEGELDYWISKGQTLFVANNVAHLGLLRGRKGPKGEAVSVVAGPWLYAFNPWAAAFVADEGANFLVPPYEIGKQDFQRVAESLPAQAFMPIVFAYPSLFRIRADLASRYDFKTFSDRDGSSYELHSGGDYSFVTPETAFSIVDRIPFLRKEGVSRFILDFSGIELQKSTYRQVMKAAVEGRVLEGTSRFNWKDGFWRPPEEGFGGDGGAERPQARDGRRGPPTSVGEGGSRSPASGGFHGKGRDDTPGKGRDGAPGRAGGESFGGRPGVPQGGPEGRRSRFGANGRSGGHGGSGGAGKDTDHSGRGPRGGSGGGRDSRGGVASSHGGGRPRGGSGGGPNTRGSGPSTRGSGPNTRGGGRPRGGPGGYGAAREMD